MTVKSKQLHYSALPQEEGTKPRCDNGREGTTRGWDASSPQLSKSVSGSWLTGDGEENGTVTPSKSKNNAEGGNRKAIGDPASTRNDFVFQQLIIIAITSLRAVLSRPDKLLWRLTKEWRWAWLEKERDWR